MTLNFEKRVWMVKQRLKGVAVTKICRSQQVSRQAFYDVWKRYQTFGLDGLRDQTVGRKPEEVPEELIKQIITIREKIGCCALIIEQLLNKKVSHNKIHKVLLKAGLVQPNPRKRRKRKWVRYERKHSNSLWQTDYKWLPERQQWLCAYIDDHSRFVTAASYFEAATTENALWLLEEGIEKYDGPLQILTDKGTQFYAARGGVSEFTKTLESKGIEHITARVRHPQTTGKIERWWQTYMREARKFASLNEFIKYYNEERIHMSLSYLTPRFVFERDFDKVSS